MSEKLDTIKSKLKEYGAVIAIVIFSIVSIVFFVSKNNSDKKFLNLYNKLAEKSELQKIGNNIYSDLAYLQNTITEQKHEIKKLSALIVYQAKISVKYEDLKILAKSDTVIIRDNVNYYPVKWYGNGVSLDGAFRLPQREFEASVSFDPITMKLNLVQDKDGLWNSIIELSNPYIFVEDIESTIVPFGVKNKNFFAFLGVLGGYGQYGYRVGGNLGIGYKGWALQGGYDNYGYNIGILKYWRF